MNKVLVIATHPDDETLGCGGTLLKHKDFGDEIHWLIATDLKESEGFDKVLINKRNIEINLVEKHFNFNSVNKLNISTTKVDQTSMAELIQKISHVINNVKPKALGQEIIRSTSPGEMVVKIVYDELVKLLGENSSEVNLNSVPPVPMMLVGLQGSGKTTTTAKLAKFLEKNKKKKIMMVSLDVYRPAAQEQLKFLGEQNNILTLPAIEGQLPTDICRRAISAANLNGAEIILFDTAGRTQIDLQMMSEIKQIESIINPTETFLVADSLTGQVAADVAKEFKNTVNLTGIILTRVDGDARGGAAVSMKYVSQVPIKFIGNGFIFF